MKIDVILFRIIYYIYKGRAYCYFFGRDMYFFIGAQAHHCQPFIVDCGAVCPELLWNTSRILPWITDKSRECPYAWNVVGVCYWIICNVSFDFLLLLRRKVWPHLERR